MPGGLPYAIDLAPLRGGCCPECRGDAAATEGTEQPSDETMSAEDQPPPTPPAADAAADEAAAGEAGADAAADDQAGDAAAADQAVDEPLPTRRPPTRLALTLPPTRPLPIGPPRAPRGTQQVSCSSTTRRFPRTRAQARVLFCGSE